MNDHSWMEKIHYQDDQADVIKTAGYRYAFFDGNAPLTKSASEAISRQNADQWKPDDKHFGMHVIAMGSEESVGPNRNGDSWPAEGLRKYHDTFTKYGCFFREHRNRCQKTEGIGTIKMAAYNEPMSRVELVIWGDKRKAEEEYEMAKAGKELSFSMSARMPHDRCSICDHKSKTTSAYCSHLKDNMLQYMRSMKKYAFARNMDDLKFFDISKVGRRADRVATYIRYMFGDDMAKAAGFGERIITGADWAGMEFDGQQALGSRLLRTFTPWEDATLAKLASAEQELASLSPAASAGIKAGAPVGIPQHVLLALAEKDLPAVGGQFAKKAMVFDFKSFTSIVSGISPEDLDNDSGFRKVALAELPTLFSDILSKGGCDCGDAASMVAPDEFGCSLSQDKDFIDNLIVEVGDNLGMEQGRMESRAVSSLDKQASARPAPTIDSGNEAFFSRTLEAYGFYVVKAAHIALRAERTPEALLMRAIPAMNLATA